MEENIARLPSPMSKNLLEREMENKKYCVTKKDGWRWETEMEEKIRNEGKEREQLEEVEGRKRIEYCDWGIMPLVWGEERVWFGWRGKRYEVRRGRGRWEEVESLCILLIACSFLV